MKSLGFRNFKKFENLAPLELGGVTFLVGENNSGKSTFTKGALLLGNFLKMIRLADVDENDPRKKDFSFKSSKFRHVYIDTFYQALCNQAQDGVISFETKIDDFELLVNVVEPSAFREERYAAGSMTIDDFKGYPEIRENAPAYYKSQLDKDTALVSSIILYDQRRGVSFEMDYQNSWLEVIFYDVELKKKYDQLVEDFNNGNFAEGSHDELLAAIYQTEQASEIKRISDNFSVSKDSKLLFKKASAIEKDIIDESFGRLEDLINDYNFEYIYAHSVHQKSTYSYDASIKNEDFVDQTISRFFNLELACVAGKYQPKKHPRALVRQWMELLNIGGDFKIEPKNGSLISGSEESKLTVTMFDGDDEYDLSTKGIGFIKLFTLLLRMAITASGNERLKTVVIEEPEQNLHPALQSKLADLFYEIYRETGCQIIVETHSEYIVRKSQVIVSEIGGGEANPFKVYYFPKDDAPYEMEYLPDGTFDASKSFGNGFYDEAAILHWQILNQ